MESGSQVASSRYSNLRKSFQLAIRSLLTAFSKEDVDRAFSGFSDAERDSLYHMFVHVVKSLHTNIEEEFDSICRETEVETILDRVDQLIEEQNLDVLSAEKTNIGDVKEKISRVKKEEIHYLANLIEKAEERNNAMRARIELLKKRQDLSATKDAVEKVLLQYPSFEQQMCRVILP
ncbi:uncharacterized protein LOC109728616 isoform X2 [Ananas comosus]|uniref:Uncharacterized protein LOC109728616 isoform X2 n=1 Tax=Ananas comosus TaxID=4615 RepID=A0A6P5H156_ANACO|nr:uncharacterized protein LOC109728616 isoform X2 [Ananas comosus]